MKNETRFMVEFNYENGIAMSIKIFNRRWQAEKFIEEEANDGKLLEMHTVYVK